MIEIRFKGIKWYLYNKVLLPDVAPHEKVNLSNNEAQELIRKTKAYFVRWPEDFDSRVNYPFWYVIKNEKEDTDLISYSSKIRSEIRRGLKNNKVDLIEMLDMRIVETLYEIYINAFRRYKSVYIKPATFEDFKKGMESYNGDIWIVTNKQVAFALTKRSYSKEGLVVIIMLLSFILTI